MKKALRILFLLVFLLLFLSTGIITFKRSIRRKNPPVLSDGPAAADVWITKYIPDREQFLVPYRLWNAGLDKRYYPEINAYLNERGQFIIGSYSMSAEARKAAESIKDFYSFCQERGIHFLYVLFPGKPEYDQELMRLGLACHRNAMADLLTQKLREGDVPCLDLRESFRAEEDFYSFFYKTEHHWTADAGLKAAREIALRLNEEFGMTLDTTRLRNEVIARRVYPGMFVGEIGTKTLGKYGEIDDYIVRYPIYEPHLRYLCHDDGTDISGGFEILTAQDMLNQSHLDGGRSLYYYYLFQNNGLIEIWDEDVPSGDLLLIKDSYSNVVSPFLALTAKHVTAWDMRFDTHIKAYLTEHPEIETVVVAYQLGFILTQSMNVFQ